MKCIVGVAVLLCVSVLIEEHEAGPPIGRPWGRRVQREAFYLRRWPSEGQNIQVPVSYRDVTSPMVHLFQAAIEPFLKSTCVSFKLHSKERDYLKMNSNGCSSLQGRQGGAQHFSLNCKSKGELQRELLHALGFSYEIQRPDSDKYIKIHWENIQSEKLEIFRYVDDSIQTVLQSPYDYRSVMHFPSTAFSVNGEPTLEAVAGSGVQLGSEEMTEEDIKRVNEFYCTGRKG